MSVRRNLLWVLILLVAAGPTRAGDVTLGEFSATSRSFRMVEGSTFRLDCVICGRPPELPAAIRGTFSLRPGGGSSTCPELLVVEIEFRSVDPALPGLLAKGSGTYRLLGSPDSNAVLQRMRLELRLNNGDTLQLDSGIVPLGAPLPWIEIDLTQTFPEEDPIPDDFVRLHLVAAPFPRLWFSTSRGFAVSAGGVRPVGEGDLLAATGQIVAGGSDLAARLGVMPIAPDLGLDAVRVILDPGFADMVGLLVPVIVFSTRTPAFSETLGALGDGDVLSTEAGVLLRAAEWLAPFSPSPDDAAPGLDALSRLPDGSFLFSVEKPFFSARLGKTINSGDILSDQGRLFRSQAKLYQGFLPANTIRGPGVDAVFVWPHGEIWFSSEKDFESPDVGVVGHGDLLSDLGRVVLRNAELLGAFDIPDNSEDLGLDALSIDAGMQFDDCGYLEQGVECLLFRADSGGRYVIFDRGEFAPGDRVRVTGRLVSPCTSTCQEGDGCILGSTLEACGLNECGVLLEGITGCILFETEGGDRFLLEDTGGFGPGERVRVSGAVRRGCVSDCLDPCLEIVDSFVTACFFENCGQLVDLGDGCVVLETASGDRYAIENIGGFEAGDTVLVSGTLDSECASPCLAVIEVQGCIRDNDVDTAGPVGEVGFFRRADCNSDGISDISDAIYTILYLFSGGEAPLCPEACNTNGDSEMDLSDGIYFLNYLFTGGSPPPSPYPGCSQEWINVYCDGEPCPCFYPEALCAE